MLFCNMPTIVAVVPQLANSKSLQSYYSDRAQGNSLAIFLVAAPDAEAAALVTATVAAVATAASASADQA